MDAHAEMHAKDWSSVAQGLQERFGPTVRPDMPLEARAKLTQLLSRELTQYDRAAVHEGVNNAFSKIRVTVDWNRFLCVLLSHLPGWWSKLAHNPGFDASTMLLLTDGSVMVQEQGGLRWKKLTPAANGSYVNGTWSDLAPMHHTRRYYASAVLKDGRVFVSGGEYSDAGPETNATEIYNPVLDTWTTLTPPAGWGEVGDAICAVLPDGRVLLGSIDSTRTAIFDPTTDTFSAGPTKGASSSEESWVLMPDATVITVRCDGSGRADKYVAASNTWVSGGTLPTGIVEVSSSEIGAGILLEDGRALFVGANGHNALYTAPANPSDPGTWTMGPDFPTDANGRSIGCKDAPACLMTNGRVLIAAGPVDGVRNDFLSPTYFFEYDGASMRRVNDPTNSGGVPYIGRMMLLPTGQILFAAETNEIYVYNYFSCPPASARPHITSAPHAVRPFHTYTLHGRLLNGLSQAVGYGDDASGATNYPILRIRHLATGRISYCRSFDHSTMGVATGASIQSTNFVIPWGAPEGNSELSVVANGIASEPWPVCVEEFHFHWPIFDDAIFARLIGSLADGPLWVWGPHGPIPVDPWGPKIAHEASGARNMIVTGLMTLRKLGGELQAARQKIALEAPLAPDDDDLIEEESDEKSAATAKAMTAEDA